MDTFKISFIVETMPFLLKDRSTDGYHFTVEGFDGEIRASVRYDFREEPLLLTAYAGVDDQVTLRFLPYRIEMLINGKIEDEEWPCGQMQFKAEQDKLVAPFTVQISAYEEEKTPCDSILWSFLNAEGWQPEENVFVGDCMPYVNQGRYHVLYLKDRRHHTSKWGFGAHQWEHISTSDFCTWDVHPTAIAITRPWEGSVCTGSWIRRGEKEYLFYTFRMADGSAAPICRSVSTDGYHFEKDTSFYFTLPDRYHGPSARDPKVICAKDGMFHMILTTSLVEEDRGCLAHLISSDLENWSDAGPIYVSDDETQPECPDYFELNGFYYLLFSLHSKAEYRYSTQPLTDWAKPEDAHIPCASVPKGAVWDGKIVFTGYQSGDRRRYAGFMTFKTAKQAENGELVF